METSKELLDKFEEAVREHVAAEAYENADPNRESAEPAKKKLDELRERLLNRLKEW